MLTAPLPLIAVSQQIMIHTGLPKEWWFRWNAPKFWKENCRWQGFYQAAAEMEHTLFCPQKPPACRDKLTIMKSLSLSTPQWMAVRDAIPGHDKSWMVIWGFVIAKNTVALFWATTRCWGTQGQSHSWCKSHEVSRAAGISEAHNFEMKIRPRYQTNIAERPEMTPIWLIAHTKATSSPLTSYPICFWVSNDGADKG